MRSSRVHQWIASLALLMASVLAMAGPDQPVTSDSSGDFMYLIGPGDTLSIFVWGNPEVSASVPVRPDGMITSPLIEDLPVSGRTSSQVAREIEKHLDKYIKSPNVTVTVTGFQGIYPQQIRVVGAAAKPQALPYREGMTVLDLMIAVGGLTEFADGNDAKIIRTIDGKQKSLTVRLKDLLKKGDIKANAALKPGDVVIIPESWF